MKQETRRSAIGALIAGRCPRCHEGPIFHPFLSRGVLRMYPRCPVCGLDFEPEPGYFLGAMYVSYAIGILTVLPVALALVFLLGVPLALTLVIAGLQCLLMMAFMFRASRIFWLHLDQAVWPR
jgi:uncharacterized protein (DUF983 family)